MHIARGRRRPFSERRSVPLDGPEVRDRRRRARLHPPRMPREDVFQTIEQVVIDFQARKASGARGVIRPLG